jgi:predicted acyltransferase (DUF342 family)
VGKSRCDIEQGTSVCGQVTGGSGMSIRSIAQLGDSLSVNGPRVQLSGGQISISGGATIADQNLSVCDQGIFMSGISSGRVSNMGGISVSSYALFGNPGISVSGQQFCGSSISTDGSLGVGQGLVVGGSGTSCEGNLAVGLACKMGSNVLVATNACIGGAMSLGSFADVRGDLSVNGCTVIPSQLSTGGYVVHPFELMSVWVPLLVGSQLSCSVGAVCSGSVSMSERFFCQDLSATGDAIVEGTASVSQKIQGLGDIEGSGSGRIASQLSIGGSIQTDRNLVVAEDACVRQALEVVNDIYFGGDLSSAGSSNIGDCLSVNSIAILSSELSI